MGERRKLNEDQDSWRKMSWGKGQEHISSIKVRAGLNISFQSLKAPWTLFRTVTITILNEDQTPLVNNRFLRQDQDAFTI